MIYLILSILFFVIAWYGYKGKKMNNFRENLKPGDKCSILVNLEFVEAEVEDISGTTVFLVLIDEYQIVFNSKVHISDVYPSRKKK